jgi:ubiquinone/menaquinone biosynthesis C-methylase UbiE
MPHTEGKMVRRARLYDLETTLLSFGRLAALHRTMVELAGISLRERILDVVCGPGRLAIMAGAAAGHAGETCGIDPAPEMVELARRKAAQAGVPVRFEAGVIDALPYPPDHFDIVLSSLMLHHLPDEVKRRGFAEVRRVLKQAGRFVAVDFGATPEEGFGHILCILGLRTGVGSCRAPSGDASRSGLRCGGDGADRSSWLGLRAWPKTCAKPARQARYHWTSR